MKSFKHHMKSLKHRDGTFKTMQSDLRDSVPYIGLNGLWEDLFSRLYYECTCSKDRAWQTMVSRGIDK